MCRIQREGEVIDAPHLQGGDSKISTFGNIALVPKCGTCYTTPMQIIAKRTLRVFWDRHPQAERPLRLWFAQVDRATWRGPADIRAMFGSADFIADNRVIFDVGGNKYRIVVHISYAYGRVLIKFVGTHAEYDDIKPETV
jgi:mRNA interferase HigB